MRLLFLASTGEVGGAEAVILDVLAGLRRARPSWRLELIVPSSGPLERQARELGVTVRVLPWGARVDRLGDTLASRRRAVSIALRMIEATPAIVAYLFGLGRALREARPDLVHSHGFKMNLLATWARPSAVPLVLHLHDYIGNRPVASRLVRLHRPRRAVGAAISRSIADDAERAFAGAMPIRVVYNGIDTTRWSPDGPRADLDALAGLPSAPRDTIRVGLVATMARWKGHEVFLEAMALLRRRKNLRGYVVGGSIYRTDRSQHSIDELRDRAAGAGLGDSVGFTGFVDDSAAAMRALDIVVHASTRPEPFGRVIVEGMATGRAVISTAIGGAAELIEPGRTAIAVTPGNAASLAAAIDDLVDDGLKRERLGVEGRARVQRCFTTASMIDSLLAVYGTVLPPDPVAR